MASSTLVKDLLFRVSSQLHDVSPQFTRWTQRELVSWLNDGQKAIAKYMPSSCSRVDAIKLAAGTKQSIERLLAGNVRSDGGLTTSNIYGGYLQSIIRNMGADGATPGRSIRLVDREVMDVNNPTWHSETGAYVSQYMFDPRMPKVFYVYPGVPSATNAWIEISYLSDPVEVSATGSYGMDGTSLTTISVDDKYIDDLVNYILARAYMKDAEFAANGNLASAHSNMFTASINAQATALSGVNPNLQSLPMNPNASLPVARS